MRKHEKEVPDERILSEIIGEIERTLAYEVEEAKYLVSDAIYRIMEENDVSRADLARAMDRSRPFVSKLLGGSNNFEISTLVQVARALGHRLNVEALFVPRANMLPAIPTVEKKSKDVARNGAPKKPATGTSLNVKKRKG